jgi:hypothetical protein
MSEFVDAPPPPASVAGIAALCIDCADPATLAKFYAALLGAPI